MTIWDYLFKFGLPGLVAIVALFVCGLVLVDYRTAPCIPIEYPFVKYQKPATDQLTAVDMIARKEIFQPFMIDGTSIRLDGTHLGKTALLTVERESREQFQISVNTSWLLVSGTGIEVKAAELREIHNDTARLNFRAYCPQHSQ